MRKCLQTVKLSKGRLDGRGLASACAGLWVRQLRDKYPYPQYVNKVMRKLQDVHLIKQISPWDAPHKKIYMLVELEPLKSSVGACWCLPPPQTLPPCTRTSAVTALRLILGTFSRAN